MSNSQINLPKTAFSMKANLPVREPEILEYWKKINLYQELRLYKISILWSLLLLSGGCFFCPLYRYSKDWLHYIQYGGLGYGEYQFELLVDLRKMGLAGDGDCGSRACQ